MGTRQRFGGDWTIEKLDILSSYLDFYITALKNLPFNKIYIDAFAGTVSIKVGGKEEVTVGNIDETNNQDRLSQLRRKIKEGTIPH